MDFVIIDTSSIIFGFEYKKDVFEIAKSELRGREILISVGVLSELSRLAKDGGKKGLSARTALQALKYKKVDVDNNTGHVDSWVFSKSKEYPHSVVITNDTALFKKLKASGIKSLKLSKTGILR